MARELVREWLGHHLSDEERFEIELLITELVTNAVRHGGMTEGNTIGLRMDVAPGALRVEVRDSGPGFVPGTPHPRDFDRGGGGLGLVLLNRFARRWGVDVDGGARVWADIPRREAAS